MPQLVQWVLAPWTQVAYNLCLLKMRVLDRPVNGAAKATADQPPGENMFNGHELEDMEEYLGGQMWKVGGSRVLARVYCVDQGSHII